MLSVRKLKFIKQLLAWVKVLFVFFWRLYYLRKQKKKEWLSTDEVATKLEEILGRNLFYCDVGARDGISEPWKSFRNLLNLVSFEPDNEAYNALMSTKELNDFIFNTALADKAKSGSLNLTESRGCSSLYEPNYQFLKNFKDYERFNIVDTISLETSYIDALYKEKSLPHLDFIKIDVQGAELDILKGGQIFLSENAIGIEVEVEFQSLYRNQPLFADVDIFIRESLELELQDLRKTYWKYPEGIGVGGAKGKLIFGDALYLRPPDKILAWCSKFDRDEARNKILIACLTGVVYGYLDYGLAILNYHSIQDYLLETELVHIKKVILKYGKSIQYTGKEGGDLFNFFDLHLRICEPTYDGWASVGRHLGMRKQSGVFR